MLTFDQNKYVTEFMKVDGKLWISFVKSAIPMPLEILAELVASEAARRAETANRAGMMRTPANMLAEVMGDLGLRFTREEIG